ncbi:MAG TPA: hypothetical protein VGI50_12770 [Solirubrobacteraceae bacterium]
MTKIYFRDGQHVIVDGPAVEVARRLHGDGPARLETIEHATVFVNWDNVLYIEESSTERPPVPPG